MAEFGLNLAALLIGILLGWYFNKVVARQGEFSELVAEILGQIELFPGLLCKDTPEINQDKVLPRLDRYLEMMAIKAQLLGHHHASCAFRELSREIENAIDAAGLKMSTDKTWVNISKHKSSWLETVANASANKTPIWLLKPGPESALRRYDKREAEYMRRAIKDAQSGGGNVLELEQQVG